MSVALSLRPIQVWLDRLDRKTIKADDGCWLWTGRTDKDGYGALGTTFGGKSYQFRAHRLSYEIHKGDCCGLCVLHRCDNPACWNPDHLFVGTQQDNIRDKMAKRRQARGSRCGRSVLVEDQVREIRARRGLESRQSLADRFGVAKGTIKGIQLRRRNVWSDV